MVALEASKPFRKLSSPELAVLRQITQEKKIPAGFEIFKQGDPGDGVYVVKDGLVEISATVHQNTRSVIAQIRPGEIFGEMAVLEFKPRSASAIAASETTVYFIPRGELLVLAERSPALALELLREISSRLREFNRRYVDEMLQAERLSLVGRFARSIIHDLKNPLSVISMTAEMAMNDRASAEFRANALTGIRQQVERISELIGEILDFTSGSKSDFVLASVNYAVFVRRLIDDIRPELELRNVTVEAGGLLPMEVALDAKRMARVFFNLLHNAADAMPGGGKVSIRCHLDRGHLVTEIADGGPGIAPEIAGKLFEAFATFGKAHGTGLGLSICKKIIEDHRGSISARNQPDGGAVFAFALPLAKK